MADSLQDNLRKLKAAGAKNDLVAASTDARVKQAQYYQVQPQINQLNIQLQQYQDSKVASDNTVQNYNAQIAVAATPEEKAALISAQAPYIQASGVWKEAIDVLNKYIGEVKASNRPLKKETLAKFDKYMASAPLKTIIRNDVPQIKYNVGSVREAYFSGKEEFMDELSPQPGNTPVQVRNAVNLWAGGKANKGMIQTWTPPSTNIGMNGSETPDMIGKQTALREPHGFQFQYNPTNISMSYLGSPSVDITYLASGKDKFNFMGTGATQSTIGFQILLNRVYDMKYYTPGGKLLPSAKNIYSPRQPDEAEQKEIYNKGTMYDLEFLLRTLLGITMPSYMRGGETADMGFVAAVPVELHLGQSLRYLVWIGGLTVNHVLFNERMVPLFSTVDISCNRMPDFAALKSDSNPVAKLDANGMADAMQRNKDAAADFLKGRNGKSTFVSASDATDS
jgi:hypothetical protein